ncbi:EamA family transporter [Streptomyces sp. NPDC048172]|uniref:EamA family transporter n=1 Tax=Streptomyces sp. NPDC048172 TaxID=3365505 RepID=UPI003713E7DD
MPPEPILKTARPLLPWLALVTVWIFWGSTYLGIRAAVDTIPPLLMAGFRYLLAGAVMFAVVGPRHARGEQRPTRRQLGSVTVVAVLMLVCGNGLLSVGEVHLDSGLAALIVATVPVWMVLVNAAVTRTRITLTMVLALLLGTTGVAVLMGGPGSEVHVGAAALVVFASLCWATGSVQARRVTLPKHPLVVTALEMLVGGVVLIVLGALTGEFARLDLGAVSGRSLVGFLWLVVAGSMLAFTAYVYANATLPNDAVATYAYVNPVVAVALGALIDGEALSVNVLLGGAVIVSAVVLIVGGKALTRRLGRRSGKGDGDSVRTDERAEERAEQRTEERAESPSGGR